MIYNVTRHFENVLQIVVLIDLRIWIAMTIYSTCNLFTAATPHTCRIFVNSISHNKTKQQLF